MTIITVTFFHYGNYEILTAFGDITEFPSQLGAFINVTPGTKITVWVPKKDLKTKQQQQKTCAYGYVFFFKMWV